MKPSAVAELLLADFRSDRATTNLD